MAALRIAILISGFVREHGSATLREAVVAPNAAAGYRVDVYVHVWDIDGAQWAHRECAKTHVFRSC